MLTGLDDIDSIQKAFDAGATDFVTKPMNWVILTQRVIYMLRSSSAMAELKASETMLENAQRIARLGHWEEELGSGEVRWSKEMYRIFGVDSQTFEPQIDRCLELVHRDDRDHLLREREAVLSGQGGRSSTFASPCRADRSVTFTCRCISSMGEATTRPA
jgi:response regulator RpfG family c-di-GMP phosphodiesterase